MLEAGVLDRRQDLDPMVEVARHDVGASEQVGGLVAGLEGEEAAVLEKAAGDRAHVDPLRHARHAGTERADGAGDDVDPRAGLRCAVELLDDRGIGERS